MVIPAKYTKDTARIVAERGTNHFPKLGLQRLAEEDAAQTQESLAEFKLTGQWQNARCLPSRESKTSFGVGVVFPEAVPHAEDAGIRRKGQMLWLLNRLI